MTIVNAIIFAIVALFILVTVHEFGHYWVAKRCGVRVERFSIGFGKPFLRFNKWGTEFALAPIPLGGYVKMLGEGQDEAVAEEDIPYSFSHKSVWQRMAVVSAGPIANFLLAIVFYCVVFMGGMTGYLPLIGQVQEGSPINQAGLTAGVQDPAYEIVSIDGVEVDTWREAFDQLVKRIGETGELLLAVRPADSTARANEIAIPIQQWQGDTEAPDFLASLGITPYTPNLEAVFGQVSEGGAAERAGVLAGDRVLSIDGIAIDSWLELRDYISQRPGTAIDLQIDRESQLVDIRLIPEPNVVDGPIDNIWLRYQSNINKLTFSVYLQIDRCSRPLRNIIT